MYASIEFAAYFHVPVEEWKVKDERMVKGKDLWQLVEKKRGRKAQVSKVQ